MLDKGFSIKVNNGLAVSSEPSLLGMERRFFSYKREMKQLFAESAQQFGALGLDEEDKQDRGRTVDE
jgi:hypothetical protein